MKAEFINILRCPNSGQELELEEAVFENESIRSGYLVTKEKLNKYEVKNFIPRLVEPDNYASNFGFQWNKFSGTQLDSFSRLTISEDRIKEVLSQPLTCLNKKKVLEAGSGAGRFTEIFLKYGADLCSFDYSSAVEANYLNNADKAGLNLFQGNIFKIPFEKAQFDMVFCLGVIQHTPNPQLAFECLGKQVKSGGMLIVDAYARNKYSKFTWKYILRPFTKSIGQNRLFSIVNNTVMILLPLSQLFIKIFGRLGTKILPIADFYNINFPSYKIRRQWSVLDTYDWYSPAFDSPQSLQDIKRYFEENDFEQIEVFSGSNGVIGRGIKK